eukprot:TRINITY_DN5298_c0_g1_i1.p1 TRINITY_DN5298_c0_g1~~TRINITY_DN5298_c0_g1_i1.p1  ORF type:complete len:228 (-),score=28.97 TRINITY_DN5298_c0_g1_i1:618-1277(-)
MGIALHIVVLLLSVLICAASNPNLKWVSFWDVQDPADLAGWANLFFSANDTAIVRAKSLGLSSLYDLENTLFTTVGHLLTLREDYLSELLAVKEKMDQYLDDKVIMGFFLGDELCWNGATFANLTAAAAGVRKVWPTATIYYNEAYPVFTTDKDAYGNVLNYGNIPEGFDWISIDFYPDEGTLSDIVHIYEADLYPKMSAHQQALYVPPAYGTVTTPER